MLKNEGYCRGISALTLQLAYGCVMGGESVYEKEN
jgi:hypothetical protein